MNDKNFKSKYFLNRKKYAVMIAVLFSLILIGSINSSFAQSYSRAGLQNRVLSVSLAYLYNQQYSDYEQKAIDDDDLNENVSSFYYTYLFRTFAQDPDLISRNSKYYIDCSSFATSSYIHSIGYDFSEYYNVLNLVGKNYKGRKKVSFSSAAEMTESEQYYYRGPSTTFFQKLAEASLSETPVAGRVYRKDYSESANYTYADKITDNILVYYRKSTSSTTKSEVVSQLKEMLEPGDVFVRRNSSGTGHAVIFAGKKVNGAGATDYGIIESRGTDLSRNSYAVSTSGRDTFSVRYTRSFEYMVKDKEANTIYIILRPINKFCGSGSSYTTCDLTGNNWTKAKESTAREALSKVAKEQYAVDASGKTIDKYSTVNVGDTITYKLRLQDQDKFSFCYKDDTLTTQAVTKSGCSYIWSSISANNGTSTSTAVDTISATVNSNTDYVSCTGGCTKNGDELTWKFDGYNTKTSSATTNDLYEISYTVKTKSKGNTDNKDGFKIKNTVNSNVLTMGSIKTNVGPAIRRQDESKIHSGHNNSSSGSGLTYAKNIYANAYGGDWSFLTETNVNSAIFSKIDSKEDYDIVATAPSVTTATGKIYKMMVSGLYGGYFLRGNDLKNRIKYVDEADFEVGDIVFRKKYNSSSFTADVYMGNGIFRNSSSEAITNTSDVYTITLHNDKLFVALRPSNLLNKVSLNANGGSGGAKSILAYTTYKNIDSAVKPTRSGYVFDGWYTAATGGTKITSSSNYSTDTLYAHWITTVVAPTTSYCNDLTYNGENQTLVKEAPKGFTWNVTTGREAKIYSITAKLSSGYVWENSNNSTVDKVISCNIKKKSLVVKANDQIIRYGTTIESQVNNVTINGLVNGHSLSKITLTQSTNQLTTNGSITPSSAEVIDGLNNVVTSNYDIIYMNGTLSIKTPDKFIVAFNSNGGTPVNSQEITKNEKAIMPATPTKTGYSFGGWYSDLNLLNEYDFNTLVTADITLYAKWLKNKYQVAFDSNGGNAILAQEVEYYDTVTKPTNPLKEGYIFGGWYTSSNFTTEYDFNTKVTKSLTLYAKWIEKNYQISYNLDGGLATNPNSYTINTSTFTLNRPTKTGYNFIGWTGSNGTTPMLDVTVNKGSTGDKNYSANYETIKYQVLFDSNGGSVIQSQELSYGSKVLEPNTPMKDGYAFAGWNSNSELTNKYDFNSTVSSNMTLYAKWVLGKYQISYNLDGGIGNNPTYYDIDTNTFILTAPKKEGYTFIGWTGSNGNVPEMNVTITKGTTGNKNYIANWKKEVYRITFNYGEIPNIEESFGDNIELPIPVKEGYRFVGWYSDSELTKEFNLDTMPAENVMLYPKWEVNTYKISFSTNGGNEISNAEYKYNDDILELPVPIKEGYRFVGWYLDEGLTEEFNSKKMISENITLYAKWTSNNRNIIKYVLYDGKNNTKNNTSYISGEELKLYDAVKKGNKFLGWYLEKDYQTRIYKISKNMSTDLTLYAKWTKLNEIDVPDTGSNTSILPILGGIILITIGGYFALNRKQENHK